MLTDWREGFHLFGGSDKQPWSADGSLLLGMRTALTPRNLKSEDSIQLGVIPFAKGTHSYEGCYHLVYGVCKVCKGYVVR